MNVILTTFVLFIATLSQVHSTPANKETGKCKFINYKETHELKSIERIRALIGKTYTSHDREGKYTYKVGICTDLEHEDAGVIQVEKSEKQGEEDNIRNIGSLTNSHLMTGSDWAFLEYKGGDNYNEHCAGQDKRTSILLSCDENVGDDDARMVFVEEEKEKDTDCYYLFEMKHKAICPDTSSTSTLSFGSIILIVFFTVLAVYLAVGFAYQRFILGSKGLEQVPNYEFWKDFGNLQADGCDLMFRTKGRRNAGFRGLGDEQLDPTEESRDESLLPM